MNRLRKNRIQRVGLLLLIIILGIGVIELYKGVMDGKGGHGEDLSQYGVHQYTIDAKFLEEENRLEVKQKVQYNNTYDEEFDTIYFHLYPNAFKERENAPFPENEMKEAYPRGFQPGYIEIKEIKIRDQSVEYTVQGEDDTLLAIHLNNTLQANEGISIDFTYEVQLPPSLSRFGYGEHTYNFGNWYPIATVYDQEGWNLEPYYEVGDPFYSEVSNYEVTITLPENYELATTGNIIGTDTKKSSVQEKVWEIEAQGVRDFAFVISDDFKVKSDSVEGIDLYVYYFDEQEGNKALEVAADNIRIFNELFGRYPYKQFSVVSNDFYIGGMEYPNLVYIDEGVFSEDYNMALEYIITHETAHQWWYGMVGNNEIQEPWIDEALTEYSTMLYYRENYGEDAMMNMFKNMIVDDYVMARSLIKNKDESIARPVYEFNNNREYSGIVYSKGAMMFYQLEQEVGRENFKKILQYYFKENQFGNVTGEGIQNITRAVTGEDYTEFFDQWLGGKAVFSLDEAV